jgi:hypothetical protein
MKTHEVIMKILGVVLTLGALSALSGCVVTGPPVRYRAVYVGPRVYVAPARTVYVRRW